MAKKPKLQSVSREFKATIIDVFEWQCPECGAINQDSESTDCDNTTTCRDCDEEFLCEDDA